MYNCLRFFSALVLLPLACAPEASHAPDLETSAQPILAGKKDTTHGAVLGIVYNNGAASEFCSGYLVTPDLVLTARHCVLSLENPNGGCAGESRTLAAELFEIEKMLVFTETSPSGPEAGLPVAEILTPEDPTLCGNDLALLRLVDPLTKPKPIALRVATPPIVDEPLTVVGYGASQGGPDTTSGTRRSRGDVVVSSVGETDRAIEGEWTVSEGPCSGDSGGPALDALGASIGVMSRGDQATCKGMVYERLDTHAAWLQAAARDSAKRLGGAPPAWAAMPGQGGAGAGGSVGGAAGASGAEAGGAAGETGESGEAGSSAAPAAAPASNDGGCAVAPWPGGNAPASTLGLLAMAALAFVRRRRPSEVGKEG